MPRRAEGNHPKIDALDCAPGPHDLFGFLKLIAKHPESDMGYFTGRKRSNGAGYVSYLDGRHIPWRTVPSEKPTVMAAIKNQVVLDRIRKETGAKRGNQRRYITTEQCFSYIDDQDWELVSQTAPKYEALQVFSSPIEDEAMKGGAYIILDEQESRKPLYIGRTDGYLQVRIIEHFPLFRGRKKHTDESKDFDAFCFRNHPRWKSWKILMLPAKYLHPFVRKSFFWDSEDYESRWPSVEEHYHRFSNNSRHYIRRAEAYLTTMLDPVFPDRKLAYGIKGLSS